MTDKDWADYFHFVLPRTPETVMLSDGSRVTTNLDTNLALCQYRASCQVELGRWMQAREAEQRLREGGGKAVRS